MYKFVFKDGVAEIRSLDTDQLIVYQPGCPINAGMRPWNSEQEALEWMQTVHPSFFFEDESVAENNSEQV